VADKLKIQEYLNRHKKLTGKEIHCGNCKQLDMCLGLEFSQPHSCPTYIGAKEKGGCTFFEWWPRCDKCNARKVDIGHGDYSYWSCPSCKE